MSVLTAVFDQAGSLVDVIAADAPNPAPAAPPAIAGRVETLMAWLKWGVLAMIFGALVFGAGAVAVGRVTNNYGAGSLGSKTLISGVAGAVAFAAAYPVFQALT